ncbi:hypothetical protein [Rathayibacter rathayi]|uniref:Toxin n=1 Tax=Rathayibacter rathayi TaxID=33887 RepID=A0ABD6W6F3_RATRA|nr:hypothetical protein [Rathayibacter rathayi]MWV75853.1 hypothetical protein [Rathayibacter rathayi NCPPB 2980 = VKM Ac-1601]PPF11965.1 hypothetical protein C5C04_11430 [Rathayibacter rathayi]PPF45180.1 hypothetical protein C5C08_12560 [Rathayibacter rathayi]PPF77711.1 hypothetical protein C5C14_12080 [Rathayibacter rathayi]PPG11558.1 hypothetical protein C5C11_12125 [Rathayibacter rathayi]
MAIRWAASADKHDIDRDDVVNAILNYVYRVEEFEEPRVGDRCPDLFIGPTRDRTQLLEVVAQITPPADIFIFHVMIARRKMLDIAERNTK